MQGSLQIRDRDGTTSPWQTRTVCPSESQILPPGVFHRLALEMVKWRFVMNHSKKSRPLRGVPDSNPHRLLSTQGPPDRGLT
jgi:hypothetical protein